MSETWIVCSSCRLRHRARSDGRCPRCGKGAMGDASPAPPTAPPPEPAPGPTGAAAPAPPASWAWRRHRLLVGVAGAGILAVAIAGSLVWRWYWSDDDPTPVVATFTSGRITQRDLEREVASLPRQLQGSNPTYLWYLTRGLVVRRALARAARAEGFLTWKKGPVGERELVQKLVRRLPAPQSLDEAQQHARRFQEMAERAIGPELTIHRELLEQMRFDDRRPAAAPEKPFTGEAVKFYFRPADAQVRYCKGVIYPGRLWYTGECENGGLWWDPFEVVWMEAVYGPPEGFLHTFAYDDTPRTQYFPLRGELGSTPIPREAFLPDMPEDLPARFHLALTEVAAPEGVDPELARSWYERVAAAFEFCEAHYYWNVSRGERTAVFKVELQLEDGVVRSGAVNVEGLSPPEKEVALTVRAGGLDPSECLLPLKMFRLVGTGPLAYTLQLSVDKLE